MLCLQSLEVYLCQVLASYHFIKILFFTRSPSLGTERTDNEGQNKCIAVKAIFISSFRRSWIISVKQAVYCTGVSCLFSICKEKQTFRNFQHLAEVTGSIRLRPGWDKSVLFFCVFKPLFQETKQKQLCAVSCFKTLLSLNKQIPSSSAHSLHLMLQTMVISMTVQ